jgi:N6-L-threonylcarbamoyladenine synthase
MMYILGIETSCDETAAAVLQDGKLLRSNVIASQVDLHKIYGGIVPEIASRKHMEMIIPVICEALNGASVMLNDIEGIAVTRGPGLVGSLLVGLSAAKAIALALKIPFVGVNHLAGHVASIFLGPDRPEFPLVALVVSGGHTNTYLMHDFQDFTVLGQTRDDAAGEAFDKAAKLLNIGYPGGVIIDRLARKGDRKRIEFPRAMRDSLNFSFSGLKTSLLVHMKNRECPFSKDELPDVAASYQEAIVDVLVEKTLKAAEIHSISRIVVCGGVASNSRLRERFAEECALKGIHIYIPPRIFCTDNAAMIAVVGWHLLTKGIKDSLNLNAVSRWPLESLLKHDS